MLPSLEKLRKLFRLEHLNGYANTAVIGGLANILNYWESEARYNKLPEDILRAVSATLHTYEDRTPAERAESLKTLWKKIQERYPEAAPEKKTVSSAPVSSAPVSVETAPVVEAPAAPVEAAQPPAKVEEQVESAPSPVEPQAAEPQ